MSSTLEREGVNGQPAGIPLDHGSTSAAPESVFPVLDNFGNGWHAVDRVIGPPKVQKGYRTSTDHGMAEYDVTPPPERLSERLQIRTAFSTNRGEVTKFLVQLEYWDDGEWYEVVRYDHDGTEAGSHDVEEDGIHRDIFKAGKKFRTDRLHSGISSNEAFEFAEDDLRENAKTYIERFQRWHQGSEGGNP